MSQAAGKLQQRLELLMLRAPETPLLHNADMQRHENPECIKRILIRQLCSPVRWTEIVRSFASAGVTHVVECGPGKVLSGLNKRIDANLQSLALADSVALHHAADILL
jgi:[acyl-carrier-protein] S-malonyltransferase